MLKFIRGCIPFALLLSWLLSSVGVQPIFAHGADSTPQLTRVSLGLYELSMWSLPQVLRPGGIAFDGLITDSRTGLPALNCSLALEITTPDGAVMKAQARPASVATSYEYIAETHLHMPGDYQIKALVEDAGQIVGAATFQITLVSDSLWLNSIVTIELLFGVMAFLWLLWEGRKVWGFSPRPSQ